jgi:hypothetical protein
MTSTPDLGLAMYVLTVAPESYTGHHRSGRQVYFEFSLPDETLKRHASDWVSRRGTVVARDFWDNYRALKDIIHE